MTGSDLCSEVLNFVTLAAAAITAISTSKGVYLQSKSQRQVSNVAVFSLTNDENPWGASFAIRNSSQRPISNISVYWLDQDSSIIKTGFSNLVPKAEPGTSYWSGRTNRAINSSLSIICMIFKDENGHEWIIAEDKKARRFSKRREKEFLDFLNSNENFLCVKHNKDRLS